MRGTQQPQDGWRSPCGRSAAIRPTGLSGHRAPFLVAMRAVERLAACDVTVLPQGETGTSNARVRRPEFASVNLLLGHLETAITGTHHAVDFARSSCRYLAEYLFRCNRRYRMRELLPRLLRAVACATALSTALARAPADAF